jgi:hypothetical protein
MGKQRAAWDICPIPENLPELGSITDTAYVVVLFLLTKKAVFTISRL